jgi:hypothetical protein
MRGLRFCATLGFEMEEATFRAIAPQLSVFEKVARERVRVELLKLLSAPCPSAALVAMATCGVWERVLPPIHEADLRELGAQVDAAVPDALVRLSILLRASAAPGDAAVAEALDNLKLSRAERRRCDALVGPHPASLSSDDAVQLRRVASALGREYVSDACAVMGFEAAARARVDAALEGAPLTPKELQLSGGELIKEGLVSPGPGVRALLNSLLAWTFEDPSRNTNETLRARARAVLTIAGGSAD